VTDTASKPSTAIWDVVGILVAIIAGLFLLGIVVGLIRWTWDHSGPSGRHDQSSRYYSSDGGRSYAPRRVEYIPQRRPEGGYRCVVDGRPGWCR
jgi:hypothetical protein